MCEKCDARRAQFTFNMQAMGLTSSKDILGRLLGHVVNIVEEHGLEDTVAAQLVTDLNKASALVETAVDVLSAIENAVNESAPVAKSLAALLRNATFRTADEYKEAFNLRNDAADSFDEKIASTEPQVDVQSALDRLAEIAGASRAERASARVNEEDAPKSASSFEETLSALPPELRDVIGSVLGRLPPGVQVGRVVVLSPGSKD